MPRNPTPKPFKTPAYWARSVYDQAIVTLTDSATKRRRDYWLGEYGTPASHQPTPVQLPSSGRASKAILVGLSMGEVRGAAQHSSGRFRGLRPAE